jgi:glucokinase
MLLAGDVGGTKTNLAIYGFDGDMSASLAEKTIQSAQYPNLETLVGDFLSQVDLKIEKACFGVAGPVVEGRVSTTNLPWEIDQEHLRRALNLSSVHLLNDLQAISQCWE